MSNSNNKIIMVTWQDAAYTFDKEFPDHLPEIQTAIGFVIEDNPEFIKIANNVHIEPAGGKALPIDGFVIPQKTILKVETLNL